MSFGVITSPKGGYRIIDSEISQHNTDNGFFCSEAVAAVFETTFPLQDQMPGSPQFGNGRGLRHMAMNDPIRTHPVFQRLGQPGWRIWMPWNDTIQGGVGASIWATAGLWTGTPVRFFITCPTPWSPYSNGVDWGLQVKTASGAIAYDSRKPIIQVLHLATSHRWAWPVDSASNDVWVPPEANYVSQNECYVARLAGTTEAAWGGLYRKGASTAAWACTYRESYIDWTNTPPDGAERHASLFARITL